MGVVENALPAVVAGRPEVELLLCCARARKDPERADRIKALVREEEIDWECLLRTARGHGTMPLLYWNLNAVCPEALPEDVLERLQSHFHANNLRNLSLSGELIRLLSVFEAQGIPAIPFKGPALASLAYENLALREFIDLDILVRRQDVSRAKELLVSMDYRPHYLLNRTQEAAFLRYEREYTFVRDDDGSMVELHWKVAPRPFSFSFDSDGLWDRLQSLSLGGATIPTFSPEDLLLFLCVHGATHLWERLEWVCDVAELVRVQEAMEWERLMKQARASGCERILLLGLFLASDLLGADLPEEVLKKTRADATVAALAREAQERLFPTPGEAREIFDKESHFHPFHLRAMERLRDRAWYCINQATAPILDDWVLRPLPAPLFPLYRVLRPIRLIGKYGRSLPKRMSR